MANVTHVCFEHIIHNLAVQKRIDLKIFAYIKTKALPVLAAVADMLYKAFVGTINRHSLLSKISGPPPVKMGRFFRESGYYCFYPLSGKQGPGSADVFFRTKDVIDDCFNRMCFRAVKNG
jgi:hypothetical protein